MDVNTKLLREYLTKKFSAEDFSNFLFDYFPLAYNEITPEMRQGKRIQLLLEHCRNYDRFPDLLANLERERPGSFHSQDFSNTPLPQSVPQFAKTKKPTRVNTTMPKRINKNVFVDEKTGIEFVRIPAGEFLYGEEKEPLYLDEYWIAKTPVTNAQYARFVAETRYKPPTHWNSKTPAAKIANHPVVNVNWHDAQAFATWAGMELPLEQQWEKAARGTDGRFYPWGNAWRENHCNIRKTWIGDTSSVGQFSPQGDSPYGCVDMAGNVWEWTASKWSVSSADYVPRGGSFFDDRGLAHMAYRNSGFSSNRDYRLGFRVVVHRPPSQFDL